MFGNKLFTVSNGILKQIVSVKIIFFLFNDQCRPVARKKFRGGPDGFREGPKGEKFPKCQNYNANLNGPSYFFSFRGGPGPAGPPPGYGPEKL
jgi:hypothetical protein